MDLNQAEVKVKALISKGYRAGWINDFLKFKKENDINKSHQAELELLVQVYIEE